jgi:hypothetical protein
MQSYFYSDSVILELEINIICSSYKHLLSKTITAAEVLKVQNNVPLVYSEICSSLLQNIELLGQKSWLLFPAK